MKKTVSPAVFLWIFLSFSGPGQALFYLNRNFKSLTLKACPAITDALLNAPYTIFPLGDSAVTIELGKEMNEELNKKVLAIQKWIDDHKWPGLTDSIIAYSSVTAFYDPWTIRKNLDTATAYEFVRKKLEQAFTESSIDNEPAGSPVLVPVCYDEDFGIDLEEIRRLTNLSTEEIIALHTLKTYRIYMLGFLPGFAYLGEIDPALIMPRKQTPVLVAAGSVGIVSNQTGIYPLDSPGGWQILGRTPLRLFDPQKKVPVKLLAGAELQFYQISREEFEAAQVWESV